MLDEFYRDILEFYMDPANVQALEEYRKAKEEAQGKEEKTSVAIILRRCSRNGRGSVKV